MWQNSVVVSAIQKEHAPKETKNEGMAPGACGQGGNGSSQCSIQSPAQTAQVTASSQGCRTIPVAGWDKAEGTKLRQGVKLDYRESGKEM